MRCTELFDDRDPLAHARAVAECAPALMAVEEYGLADRLLGAIIAAGQNANALGLLSYCLGAKAELEVWIGRWSSAYANGSEAIDLAREAGQAGQLSYNLARLARLEAAQGREDECRAHVAEALELAAGSNFGSTLPFAESGVGLLELGLGRLDAAVAHFLRTSELCEREGFKGPGRLEWEPDLVEAYVRAGRRDEAEEAIAHLERRAHADAAADPERTTHADGVAHAVRIARADPNGRSLASAASMGPERRWVGSTVALAAACRCRGLLANEDELDRVFAAARAWHERTTTPFELARTELCYGEQLRRHGRRIDARHQLRSALEPFDRLGAVPWARRARVELAATGETVHASRTEPGEQLTGVPQLDLTRVSMGDDSGELTADRFRR